MNKIYQFFGVFLISSLFLILISYTYCWNNACHIPFSEKNKVLAMLNSSLNPNNKYSFRSCNSWSNYNEISEFVNNSDFIKNLNAKLIEENGKIEIIKGNGQCIYHGKIQFFTKNRNSRLLDEIRLKYGDTINNIDYDFLFE